MTEQITETETDETKGVQDPHTPEEEHETPTPEEGESRNPDNPDEEEPDTFPRSVVEDLRKESARYREKAKKAETYARELFYARVAATGRLADPDDLPFDEALLDDHDALLGAVEEAIARKPHLASRKPRGEIGQGLSSGSGNVDLAGILRSRA